MGNGGLSSKTTKIPLLIASNCEAGGNGGCQGGTPIANGAAMAAIDSPEEVFKMAEISAREAAAVGCNWNFAPVVDLLYNWRNTIVQLRAFNDSPEDVIRYAKAFFKGMKTQNIATCMKHFPGDGTEENDQHLIMGINEYDCDKWDRTYGKVYKELIDEGVMTIMAGHIALPAYSRKLRPGIKDEEIRPATLAPELITDLLKGKLGFNGLVVTDASHMIGMFGATIPRSQQVPQAIAAGCDMFLFFNDPDEDYQTMLTAYRNGTISEERMTEALTRILGLKAHLGLNKKAKEDLVPQPEAVEQTLGKEEYKEMQKAISDDCITLVKYKDQDVLPVTPQRYKRIMIVHVKGAESGMSFLMKAMGMGGKKKPGGTAERKTLRERI